MNLSFGSIWFVADFDKDGTITRIEEHDIREGGMINIPTDVNSNEYFLETVYGRTEFEPDRIRARRFVATCGRSGE